jgi:hypothetical protein
MKDKKKINDKSAEWQCVYVITPPPEDWIVTFKDGAVYLWDDFEKQYSRYILGKGLWLDQTIKADLSPDADEDEYYKNLDNKWFRGENTKYYRDVINRINDVQFNPKLLNLQLPKPIREPGVRKDSKRGPYKKSKKKKRTFICKGCGRTFTLKASKRQQFHSEACRRAYWRKKKRQKDAEKRRKRQY